MKLWQKKPQTDLNSVIEKFTIGNDQTLDLALAPFDVLGSMAHVIMLSKIGLVEPLELSNILGSCVTIYKEITEQNTFIIEENVEDIHSQIELILTQKLGESGKKIHSGRSRNDQVLVDLKMYFRSEIEEICGLTTALFYALNKKSEVHKNDLLPGYTHLQIAMPSSFGLWFGAYAESLIDDLLSLQSTYKIINKNPLGSGAGYGSSFPLDRKLTTELLGFDDLNYNVVYAQMTRGKSELALAQSIGLLANTMSRLSMDICLYNSQNFGFIKLPDSLTTGSSIMPHKKNPDIAELLRGKCNRLKSVANELYLLQSNLPSGYHREMQLTKEIIFPAINEIKDCIRISTFMIEQMKVSKDLLNDPKFDLIFSVENTNYEVMKGLPFRDAYVKIGTEIEEGNFKPLKSLNHTLVGSIGNLCNKEIKVNYEAVLNDFNFEKTKTAFAYLLKYKVE